MNSLRFTFTALLISISCILLTAFYFYSLSYDLEAFKESKVQEVDNDLNRLQQVSEYSLVHEKVDFLQLTLQDIAVHDSIKTAMLISSDGKVSASIHLADLSDSFKEALVLKKEPKALAFIDTSLTTRSKQSFEISKNKYVFTAPVFTGEQEQWGTVVIMSDFQKRYDQLILNSRYRLFENILLVMIIMLALWMALNFYITKRLELINEAIDIGQAE